MFTEDYWETETEDNPYDTVKKDEGISKPNGSHQMHRTGVLSQYKK
jgi:hypothetical protein